MRTCVYGSIPHYVGEILRLGLISHRKGFSKMFFKPDEFKNACFSFSTDGKHYENETLRRSVVEEYLMRFQQRKASISKFLRLSMNGTSGR